MRQNNKLSRVRAKAYVAAQAAFVITFTLAYFTTRAVFSHSPDLRRL